MISGSWCELLTFRSSAIHGRVYSEQAQYGVTSNQLWNNFAYYSTALNPNLTWETSEQYDLGLDMEMFNNRLSLSMDYFDKRTFNLIQPQPMNWPSTTATGLSTATVRKSSAA